MASSHYCAMFVALGTQQPVDDYSTSASWRASLRQRRSPLLCSPKREVLRCTKSPPASLLSQIGIGCCAVRTAGAINTPAKLHSSPDLAGSWILLSLTLRFHARALHPRGPAEHRHEACISSQPRSLFSEPRETLVLPGRRHNRTACPVLASVRPAFSLPLFAIASEQEGSTLKLEWPRGTEPCPLLQDISPSKSVFGGRSCRARCLHFPRSARGLIASLSTRRLRLVSWRGVSVLILLRKSPTTV